MAEEDEDPAIPGKVAKAELKPNACGKCGCRTMTARTGMDEGLKCPECGKLTESTSWLTK